MPSSIPSQLNTVGVQLPLSTSPLEKPAQQQQQQRAERGGEEEGGEGADLSHPERSAMDGATAAWMNVQVSPSFYLI